MSTAVDGVVSESAQRDSRVAGAERRGEDDPDSVAVRADPPRARQRERARPSAGRRRRRPRRRRWLRRGGALLSAPLGSPQPRATYTTWRPRRVQSCRPRARARRGGRGRRSQGRHVLDRDASASGPRCRVAARAAPAAARRADGGARPGGHATRRKGRRRWSGLPRFAPGATASCRTPCSSSTAASTRA